MKKRPKLYVLLAALFLNKKINGDLFCIVLTYSYL